MKNNIKNIVDVNDLPGKKGLAFLRLVPGLIFNPYKTFSKLANSGKSIIPLSFLNEKLLRFIVVNDLGLIEHILINNYTNYTRKKMVLESLPFLGNGLLTSEHEEWKINRKIIQKAFHSKVMASFLPVMNSSIYGFNKKVKPLSETNKKIDIQFEMKILMLEVLFKTHFSDDYKFDSNQIIDVLNVLLDDANILNANRRLLYKKVISKFGIKLIKSKKVDQALNKLEKVVSELIEKSITKEIDATGVLLVLVEEYQKGNISKKQIRDEIMTFFFAGFDTVASLLVSCWFLLSKNPEAQSRFHNEIDTVLGDNELTFENLEKLEYSKRIIDETLRLYPPAWSFFRVVEKDDVYKNIRIRKNSLLMISPYALHRRKDLWERPDEFNPDRFLDTELQKPAKSGYIPFGDGPHICIGKKMAIFESLLIIAKIGREYKFTLVGKKNLNLAQGIILKSKREVFMQIVKR